MDTCCLLDPRFKDSFCANVEDTKPACIEEAIKLLTPTAAPPELEASVLLPLTEHVYTSLYLCCFFPVSKAL